MISSGNFGFFNIGTGKNKIPLQTDQRGIRYTEYILLGSYENVLGISMPLPSVCKGIYTVDLSVIISVYLLSNEEYNISPGVLQTRPAVAALSNGQFGTDEPPAKV